MTKKIFKSIMLASAVVLGLGLALVMGILYYHFGNQITGELKREAVYLSRGVELNGEEYLDRLQTDGSRITYIDTDGTVLFDNQSDASKMENHRDRKEVSDALTRGKGQATRMSKTLAEKTVYYALRLKDGKVLRVSSTQYSILALVLELVQPMLWVILAMLILSGIFSSRISKR